MTWIPQKIVFIANTKKPPHSGYNKYMAPVDPIMLLAKKLLERTIRNCGYQVDAYSDIKDFMDNIGRHKNDLVFPYYFGVGHKMRQTSVQAVCENYNIKYIGSDAYARAITTDKVLAKDLCREIGIATPQCKTVFSDIILPDITSLTFPVIVKPRYEGDSIGITKSSVCSTVDEALERAVALYQDIGNPVIIEEYIKGKEMSAAVIGYNDVITKMSFIEYLKNSDIYSYSDKRFNLKLTKFRSADTEFNGEIRQKIIRLFSVLDKLEYARIDFLVRDGKFYNLEITTDPSLSARAGMFWGFKNEMSFKQFIQLLITNCLTRYSARGEI